MACSPLKRRQGSIFQLEEVRRVSERLGCTPAEAILRWHRARGIIPGVKSRNRNHLIANLTCVEGTPDQREDSTEIARIEMSARRGCDRMNLKSTDSETDSCRVVERHLEESSRALQSIDPVQVAQVSGLVLDAILGHGAVYAAGNGGSLAQAQHLVGELVGRFRLEREPFRAVALGIDAVTSSALANDYSFEVALARQLLGLGRPGDVLVALSTSGASPNIVRLCESAQELGVTTVAIVGADDSALARLANVVVAVGQAQTSAVQEAHLAIIHAICAVIDFQLESRN